MNTYRSPWMTEELEIFRKSVRQFMEEEYRPHQLKWRAQHHADREAWSKAGAMGLLLTDVPEEYGGGGGNFAFEAVVIEELIHAGINFGTQIQSIVAHYLLTYGTEQQKQKWLPAMAKGELVGALAMTEPAAGSVVQAIRTTAIRQGDEYVINGSKTFITNGYHADLVCLAAKTDPSLPGSKGTSLIMVETRGLPGYRVGRELEKLGQHEQDTCELFFDDVRVPAANLLGPEEGKGFKQMMDQLPYERTLVAIAGIAAMERAVEITVQHTKERKMFGKTLFDLQHTRFTLAECRTEAVIGRVFIDYCIQQLMAGKLDTATASMAKYWLTDKQSEIADECLQLHGGYGYSPEYEIGNLWVDARVQRIYAGANEVMKELIARSL